jgi:anti-sigma28 factor (negative regulator of flagellin synthesis)
MRKTILQREGEVRAEKVQELRRLVQNGSYHPDPVRIAEAMISHARRTMCGRRLDGPGHA